MTIENKFNIGFKFGTKGETLQRLALHASATMFCEQVLVDRKVWRESKDDVYKLIQTNLENKDCIIRSSAANEDGMEQSLAGAHLSLTNIENTKISICNAIDKVFASYEDNNDVDQVLIQNQITNVELSGVVFTRDLVTGGPYYVINYDDMTGRTDTVTSGGESKELKVRRNDIEAVKSKRIRKLLNSIKEIEYITGTDTLDIEFCVTENEDIFILQVRLVPAQKNWIPVDDVNVDKKLDDIKNELGGLMKPGESVFGESTIFGEMPDWNPAEMIGNSPRPLALSLYKKLITNEIWLQARIDMGYMKIPLQPLLIDFAGRPYIDVRRSLNSFLPDKLNSNTASKIIDIQIDKLINHREYHDKLEFMVAITCSDFSLSEKIQELRTAGLDESECEEFKGLLTQLTKNAINEYPVGLEKLGVKTKNLEGKHTPNLPDNIIKRIHCLLSECATNGTLPFSILARHGFIGASLLRSMVEREALTSDEEELFYRNIHTITSDIVSDMYMLNQGEIEETVFLEKYGHLRPGTYDITSHRYDARPDLYIGQSTYTQSTHDEFYLSAKSRNNILKLMEEENFNVDIEHLLGYIKTAIAARESAKFSFTKNISDALELIAEWGGNIGLDRDDLSYLSISDVNEQASKEELAVKISNSKDMYNITRAIHLPHLITSPIDVDVSRYPYSKPNFITHQCVVGPIIYLNSDSQVNIDDHIVFIEAADPGFDWIFSHNIKALVTKYGGVNSHMSIRCAEFGVPAAIGCGERLFDKFVNSKVIELNCAARTITTLNQS